MKLSWLYQPLDREIYKIAVPAFLGFLAFILFDIINIFWVGKLGTQAIAGVASAAFLTWAIFASMNATTVGANSLIAQLFGAGRRNEARKTAVDAAWLSVAASILITLILWLTKGAIFRFMGLQPQTAGYANSYLTIYICALPLFYLCNLSGSIFNAYGDTKTNVIIMSSSVAINMILDPILILGYGTGRPFGVTGAAAASVTATTIALCVQTIFLRRKNYIPHLVNITSFPNFKHAGRILAVGLPSASVNVAWSLVYPALTPIITRFGEAPLAALSVCFRWEDIPYYLAMGFSTAMAALVGQAYGRRDNEHAKLIVKRGRILITTLLVPVAAAFILCPAWLVKPLTSDPAVIANAECYLRIIGCFEVFLGWELLFQGAFNGLGHSKTYMMIVLPLTLARWPAAWFLAITCGFGTAGIWWAISLSTFAKGVWLGWLFIKGKTVNRLLGPAPAEPVMQH